MEQSVNPPATTAGHMCPCCGFSGLAAPAYANVPPGTVILGSVPPCSKAWGTPSGAICPCCGFQFRNDEEPGTAAPVSFDRHFAEWIVDGTPWFDPSKRPEGWSFDEQLSRVKRISFTTPLPTEQQCVAICEMCAWAFVEIRALGRLGRAQQASDLAEVFHNILQEMWGWGGWQPEWFRATLKHHQKKYHSESDWYECQRDYVTWFDNIWPQYKPGTAWSDHAWPGHEPDTPWTKKRERGATDFDP